MLVRSATLTNLSGSLAGVTAARNRGGAYLRNRTTPVNPLSARQTVIRNAFRASVVAWTESLGADQRSGWASYGLNVPVKNRLGDTINLTGQNWYVASSSIRRQANAQLGTTLTIPDDAPGTFDRGELPADLDCTGDATELTVTYDTIPGASAQDVLLVYVSRPVNPTINFFNGPYQLAGAIIGTAASPQTVSYPGVIPQTGQVVYVRFVMSRADGRFTAPFDIRVVVA